MAKRKATAAATQSSPTDAALSEWLTSWRAGAALLIVATCLAYLPLVKAGFIWDDRPLLTENLLVQQPGGLARIWFSFDAYDYWPITNTSYWIEWRLWGRHPLGYHLTNLLLHVLTVMLVWAVLRELGIPGAFLAALLFAVHPANVETVAWIAQRKTLLATLFCLASIWCYVRAERPTAGARTAQPEMLPRWYWLSLGAFVLGMLSKTSIATLPLILLVIVWWQRGWITWQDLAKVAPFLILAAALVAFNLWFQARTSPEMVRTVTWAQRFAGAGRVIWFYLYKALLPINLMFVYPQWEMNAGDWRSWLPLVACVAVTIGLWWQRQTWWGRSLLFAWAFFCLALVPVLGLTDTPFMIYSLVADHYQYLAIIAVVAIVAAGGTMLVRTSPPAGAWIGSGVAAAVVVVLMFATAAQATRYRDELTVWQTNQDQNPKSQLVIYNLGVATLYAGDPQGAIKLLEQSLAMKPDDVDAHNNLGAALEAVNRIQEALEHYRAAVRLSPYYFDANTNLGNLLRKLGHREEAIDRLNIARQLAPGRPEGHINLGSALLEVGRSQEALDQFAEAVKLYPDYFDGQYNLGTALLSMNRAAEAIQHFQRAAQIRPDSASAENDLGLSLLNTNKAQESLEHFRRAIELDANFPKAYFNLGTAMLHLNRPTLAVDAFEEALRLRSDYAEVYANLATAKAALNRRDEAIAAAQKAIELSRATGNDATAGAVEAWLTQYRAGQGGAGQK